MKERKEEPLRADEVSISKLEDGALAVKDKASYHRIGKEEILLITCPLVQNHTIEMVPRGERLNNEERSEPGITLELWFPASSVSNLTPTSNRFFWTFRSWIIRYEHRPKFICDEWRCYGGEKSGWVSNSCGSWRFCDKQ
jgi:hypothetical protein